MLSYFLRSLRQRVPAVPKRRLFFSPCEDASKLAAFSKEGQLNLTLLLQSTRVLLVSVLIFTTVLRISEARGFLGLGFPRANRFERGS